MSPEVKIYDSHRMVPSDYWKNLGKFYAENVWNNSVSEATENIRNLFERFEDDYAAKWFDMIAYFDKEIVGVMRILKNPLDRTGWYFCDVHTARKCRRQGIAAVMYEAAIKTVEAYTPAERIEASISASNVASIELHKRFGFIDTGKTPHFANFSFEEDETVYELKLFLEYPVFDTDLHRKKLCKLFRKFYNESGEPIPKRLSDSIKRRMKAAKTFNLVWCGEYAVGFRYEDEEESILFFPGFLRHLFESKYPMLINVQETVYKKTKEECTMVPRRMPDGFIKTFFPKDIMPDVFDSANFGQKLGEMEYMILEDGRVIVKCGTAWFYCVKY